MDSEFTRDMGYSRSDFLRVLPTALRDFTHTIEGDLVTVTHSTREGRLLLRLADLPNRVLGGFNIERLEVHFMFEGFTAEAQAEFMLYFDRGYRRGGG